MHDEIRDQETDRDRTSAPQGDRPAERESERDAAKSGGSDREHTNHTPPDRFGADDLSQSMRGRETEERGEIF
jgi:hypothetical protein